MKKPERFYVDASGNLRGTRPTRPYGAHRNVVSGDARLNGGLSPDALDRLAERCNQGDAAALAFLDSFDPDGFARRILPPLPF